MCNLGIFTTLLYSTPGRLRAQGILRNLSSMYDGCFLQNPVKYWYFQNSKDIQNPVKYFWWKILFTTLCDLNIFRTVAYSESKAYSYSEYCQTSITKYFIQNLVQPWHIQKHGILSTPVYSESKAYSEPCRISQMELFIKNIVYL